MRSYLGGEDDAEAMQRGSSGMEAAVAATASIRLGAAVGSLSDWPRSCLVPWMDGAWQYADTELPSCNTWRNYPELTSIEIDIALHAMRRARSERGDIVGSKATEPVFGPRESILSVWMGSQLYVIDLEDMTELCTISGCVRPIRRVVVTHERPRPHVTHVPLTRSA